MSEKEKLVGVMLDESIIEKLKAVADKYERSLSGQVRYILKQWIDENEE